MRREAEAGEIKQDLSVPRAVSGAHAVPLIKIISLSLSHLRNKVSSVRPIRPSVTSECARECELRNVPSPHVVGSLSAATAGSPSPGATNAIAFFPALFSSPLNLSYR